MKPAILLSHGVLFFAALAEGRAALLPEKYAGWGNSGSLFLLTTPEGADLPASAIVEGFPVLVRLHQDSFDFTKAQAHGEDVRFTTGDGLQLVYQIEEWDAVRGEAIVWVRVPEVVGNARQQLRVFWGNPDAQSESNAKAVFGESNGYLSVWHLGDVVLDEVGKKTRSPRERLAETSSPSPSMRPLRPRNSSTSRNPHGARTNCFAGPAASPP